MTRRVTKGIGVVVTGVLVAVVVAAWPSRSEAGWPSHRGHGPIVIHHSPGFHAPSPVLLPRFVPRVYPSPVVVRRPWGGPVYHGWSGMPLSHHAPRPAVRYGSYFSAIDAARVAAAVGGSVRGPWQQRPGVLVWDVYYRR